MQERKGLLIKPGVALAVVLLGILSIVGLRNYEYQNAAARAGNYQYECAEELFLAMNGYRDSEEIANKMAQMTERTKTEIKKLLPIPEFDEEHDYKYTYIDPENEIAIAIWWLVNSTKDAYAMWIPAESHSADHAAMELFFGPVQTEHRKDYFYVRYVRFDPDTEEYIFIQHVSLEVHPATDDLLDFTEQYRGKQNEDGSIEIYNEQGKHYLFFPYSYSNLTTNKEQIVNEDLRLH